MQLEKIDYKNLNARQQESYNFQKVSAVLADYGFSTIRLSDDWQSSDFIAQHIDGELFLKIQLKGRLTVDKKYMGKNIYVCFHLKEKDIWFLYPHDQVMEYILSGSNVSATDSWKTHGGYSFPKLSKKMYEYLEQYVL